MTSGVSVTLELAVLVLAAGLLFAYWQLGRREDGELSKMVDKAIPATTVGRRTAVSARTAARIVTAPAAREMVRPPRGCRFIRRI